MPELTTKELSAIEDQLTMEQSLIKKYRVYAAQCQDPGLKTSMEQIVAKHQNHYDTLFRHLN